MRLSVPSRFAIEIIRSLIEPQMTPIQPFLCPVFLTGRNSGLALLSKMAAFFPAQMASRLRVLLDEVCAAAACREGLSVAGVGARAVLRQTQKAVQSIVPALRAHGAVAGVNAHFVVEVRSGISVLLVLRSASLGTDILLDYIDC